jgi:chromosomal replication initiation ATPase DnaA
MPYNESIGVVFALKNCAYATLKKNKIIKIKTLKMENEEELTLIYKMENNIQQHIKRLSAYEYSLMNTICDYSNIKLSDLLGQKRKKKFVDARKVTSFILKQKGYTHQNIGEIISIVPKDHTTIMYHFEKAKAHYEFELEFRNLVIMVKNKMKVFEDKQKELSNAEIK